MQCALERDLARAGVVTTSVKEVGVPVGSWTHAFGSCHVGLWGSNSGLISRIMLRGTTIIMDSIPNKLDDFGQSLLGLNQTALKDLRSDLHVARARSGRG